MTDQELLRYSRHLLLGEMGVEAQERLQASHCVVIGVGGLGSSAALFLASAGVGRITVVDGDTLELSNLQRQVLYRQSNLGQSKVQAAKTQIQALNSHCQVTAVDCRASEQNLNQLIRDADVALDCTDNFTTRHAINRVCYLAKKPLVSGAALQFQGQLISFDFRPIAAGNLQPRSGCYACVFAQEDKPNEANCATYGVFAPLVGVIGSLQAGEVLKLLTDAAPVQHGVLQLFDARSNEWCTLQTTANLDCAVCAGGASFA